jgi:hypothetical protein
MVSEKMIHIRKRAIDIAAEELRWSKLISKKQTLLLEEAFLACDGVTPMEEEINNLSKSVEIEESAVRSWFVRKRNQKKGELMNATAARDLGDESEGDDEIILITEGEEKSEKTEEDV